MLLTQKITRALQRSGYRLVVASISVLLVTGVLLVTQQHAAAVRFKNRSLYINSSRAGDTTFYTVSFTYPTANPVGSVRILFCDEAIASLPCDAPDGLDLSGAILTTQTGETGFTLTQQTQNSIIISRPAVMSGLTQSKYTFTNVVNPTNGHAAFYARLNSYASSNASGSFIDYGSIASTTAMELGIAAQVPPILIFCTGRTIPTTDCADAEGPNFEEFPDEPQPEEPLYTSSQMVAYTNARNGYVISMVGRSLTSGIYEIPAITDQPEISIPGKGQFGVNLAVNNTPNIGQAPVGPGSNTTLNTDYTQSDKFLFNDGDILITSDGVTLDRKFTVSYIINVPPDQHPGVYNTTVTFICTGNF